MNLSQCWTNKQNKAIILMTAGCMIVLKLLMYLIYRGRFSEILERYQECFIIL